jgi:aldose 1-epimerase
VSPNDGGRVASLTVDGVDLILRHDPSLPAAGWGSYPMVPWAGRIRRGAFSFDGVDYQLPINFEPHAIHGTGFEQPWGVRASDIDRCVLECELEWELGGTALQSFVLTAESLTCTLSTRAGDRPMPASLGWHPWFIKPEKVDLRFERMYLRDDDYITDGRIAEPPPPPPWDDCFTGPLVTPCLLINGVAVSITSDCDYWVVYDVPPHATCVEPQTATPDAFNLGGAARLEPGEELRRSMTISWV